MVTETKSLRDMCAQGCSTHQISHKLLLRSIPYHRLPAERELTLVRRHSLNLFSANEKTGSGPDLQHRRKLQLLCGPAVRQPQAYERALLLPQPNRSPGKLPDDNALPHTQEDYHTNIARVSPVIERELSDRRYVSLPPGAQTSLPGPPAGLWRKNPRLQTRWARSVRRSHPVDSRPRAGT